MPIQTWALHVVFESTYVCACCESGFLSLNKKKRKTKKTVGQCARCHIVCGKQHLDDILLPVDKQSKDPGAPGSLGPPRIHHLPVEETQYKEVSGIPWRSPRLWQILSDQWKINMTVMIYVQLMSLLWAISEGDCQHYVYWETPSTVSQLSRSRTN